MKKLILGLVLSLAMVFAVGCGEDDPIEVFERAVEKTNEIEQYTTTADINMDIESPDMAQLESMMPNAGNINVNMDMAVDGDNVKVDASYSIMGMAINMEMYGNAEQSIMKMPMYDKYLVMDNTIDEDVDIEAMEADMKSLSNSMYNSIAQKIREDGELVIDDTEVEIAGELKEVRVGTLKLSDEAVKDVMITTIEELYSSEDFMTLMESQQLEESSEEDMQASLEELRAQLENIKIENFEFTVYIDEDDYIVRQDMKMNIVMDENNSLNMDLVTEISAIGQDQNIEFPELTDENSIDYGKYMKQMQENMENINPEDFQDSLPEGFDFNFEGGTIQ